MIDYLKDPGEIYELSFKRVRAATDLSRIPGTLEALALRIVHASATPDIVEDLTWHLDPVPAARSALAAGAPVFVDTHMVAEGIIKRALPANNEICCTLDDPAVRALQRAQRTTRSAAGVDLWRGQLHHAIVVIGNAPTALFRLLELLEEGEPPPRALFAFPVGFVGASESKQALIDSSLEIPYVTLKGRRGGSAIASAAFNAVTHEHTR